MSDHPETPINHPAQPDTLRLHLHQVDLTRTALSHADRDRADLRRGPTTVDPVALLALAPPGAPRFFWAAPEGGLVIAAYGAAHCATAEGPERLAIVARACAALRSRMELDHRPVGDGGSPVDGDPPGPIWLGGFAFEDRVSGAGLWAGFPAAAFTLPEVALMVRGGQAWLALAGPAGTSPDLRERARAIVDALVGTAGGTAVAGELDPAVGATASPIEPERGGAVNTGTVQVASTDNTAQADADLRERIARTIDAIRRGVAEKVVLATSRTVQAPHLDSLTVLARLREKQPGCFHFMCAPGSTPAFLGASPERLVGIAGDRLSTVALAGSARRDADPLVDRALGEALLASAKDRAEHALVVAAILRNLDGYALDLPAEPRLRRLATIQHLETPIAAQLPGQGDVLAEAARLHPTPALGGTPRAAALALIRAHEGLDRGWYGGGIGWIDGCGNGELAVAIRSLLVGPSATTAFAGAGLVAASEPEAELREIGLKLESVLTSVDPEVLSSAFP